MRTTIGPGYGITGAAAASASAIRGNPVDWDGAEALGLPFGSLARLLLVTGQRRNEVAGMRRYEIAEANAVWTIPAARTKNGLAHEVPLSV
jgi:integrase